MVKLNLRQALVLTVFAAIAAVNALIIANISLQHAEGKLLLPLDDVYIHFQYARQIASGEPYIYNPGSSPTSGATSFLYPHLLAFGYLFGFHDLSLGLWAIMIGAVCLFLSMLAIKQLLEYFESHPLLVFTGSLFYGLNGLIVWHYFSGMETGFVLTAMLWSLVFYVRGSLPAFVVWTSILALSRPEAGILAAIAAGLMAVRVWRSVSVPQLLLLSIPVGLNSVQPLLNFWLTGSFSASGSQAKSVLASVSADLATQIQQISAQFTRIWLEWFSGLGADGTWYQIPLVGVAASGVLLWMLFRKKYRSIAIVICLWFLVLSASVATLDTAFWHLKRYQMPMYAVVIPIVVWGLARLDRHYFRRRSYRVIASGIMLVFALATYPTFTNLYAINVGYVYAQPYQMAMWLQENTASDAVVAVHDVGMMRYVGDRTTLDLVGLTTPGAAAYWRNGPGSVMEYLLEQQPDYIASYGRGHGYGLGYLADTSLYADSLADFVIPDWQRTMNVALAADSQGIYAPDWGQIMALRQDAMFAFTQLFPQLAQMQIVDVVNVADITSEIQHDYRWQASNVAGYATVPLELPLAGCADCRLLDGARQFNGSETFTFQLTELEQTYVLLSIVHATGAGQVEIEIQGQLAGSRVIAEIPGYWMLLATLIPGDLISPRMSVSVVANLADHVPYVPATHLLLMGTYPEVIVPDRQVASYQDGAFSLTDFVIQQERDMLFLDLNWYTDGHAKGDYRLFVHVYQDVTQPPVAQWDGYPGNGGLPPGNWIAGMRRDTISIPISNLTNGQYTIAAGLYDPARPVERLLPVSQDLTVSDDGRLWLGEIRIDR